MMNLIGVETCDNYIRTELTRARIEIVEGHQTAGEIPFSLTGTIGNWTLERKWNYWEARVSNGNGFPRAAAEALNERFRMAVCAHGIAGGDDITHEYTGRYHITSQEGLNVFAVLADIFRQ